MGRKRGWESGSLPPVRVAGRGRFASPHRGARETVWSARGSIRGWVDRPTRCLGRNACSQTAERPGQCGRNQWHRQEGRPTSRPAAHRRSLVRLSRSDSKASCYVRKDSVMAMGMFGSLLKVRNQQERRGRLTNRTARRGQPFLESLETRALLSILTTSPRVTNTDELAVGGLAENVSIVAPSDHQGSQHNDQGNDPCDGQQRGPNG